MEMVRQVAAQHPALAPGQARYQLSPPGSGKIKDDFRDTIGKRKARRFRLNWNTAPICCCCFWACETI